MQLISRLSSVPLLDGTDVDNNIIKHVDFSYYFMPDFKFNLGNDQSVIESDYISVTPWVMYNWIGKYRSHGMNQVFRIVSIDLPGGKRKRKMNIRAQLKTRK